MSHLGEVIRFIHVAFGATGLLAFWVPVFAKKGAVNHVRFGKVFVWSAYVVVAAAAFALLIRTVEMMEQGTGPTVEPQAYAGMVFLAYLTFVTFAIVHYGMQVLQSKGDPVALRTGLNVALAWASIAASVTIISYALIVSPSSRVLLFALSPIGIANGIGQLRYISRSARSPRAWMYEHLGAMLGAGIAFHTAFAVFGSSRLFDFSLTGWLAIVPWIAPAIIGIPAINIWTRHYQRKFGEAA